MNYSLNQLYQAVGITRQGVHKHLQAERDQAEIKGQLVVLIQQIRIDHPTMSLRSMYYKLQPSTIGRDRFEHLCVEWGFKIQKAGNQRRTTDSSGVIRFPNLISNLRVRAINQVWVTDITYYELNQRFFYLTFISDMNSKLIKGYSVSSSLRTRETTIPALKMALRNYTIPEGLILHSDGGGQYYSHEFLSITKQNHILNSMCKEAYENPQAERLNGIIKNNYLKPWGPANGAQLVKMVDRAVYLFNHEKPHKSLNYLTPIQIENNNNFALDNLSKAKTRRRQDHATYGASSPSVAGQPVSGSDLSSASMMNISSKNGQPISGIDFPLTTNY
jgi:putative transposase